MDREGLARAICKAAYLRGDFLLRSGTRSSEYFDKYRFEAHPAILLAIAEHLAPLVPPGTTALAGLELGGVPVATVLAQLTGLPTVFVRKAAKAYGTAQLAEGISVKGARLCVVEDVITSGGQAIASTGELRALGADITGLLCVIDRESGGAAAASAVGITLRPLFRYSELRPYLEELAAAAI